MSTRKFIDRVCVIGLTLAVMVWLVLYWPEVVEALTHH